MKYIVTVDWKEYVFESGTTALDWAAVAKTHATEDIEVKITLVKETD